MKKVSIIIPAYNKAELTVKTVESVLNQTCRDIEIIVVDDGSTDHTRQLLSSYADRITYIYKENGGACSARNQGIKLAQGEYIGFLDCDDLYMEDKVEKSVAYLEKNPAFGCVYTAACFIDNNGQVVGQYSHPESRYTGWISHRLILSGNHICNSTPIIRKACLKEVGIFDETIFSPADWDMWLRISRQYQIGYIPEPLTKYRVVDNYTFKHLEQSKEDERKVLEKFFRDSSSATSFLKRRAWSNFYLRYAQCYLIKNDFEKMKNDFCLSFQNNPFNYKAGFLFVYFLLAPGNLISKLRKRILRFAD